MTTFIMVTVTLTTEMDVTLASPLDFTIEDGGGSASRFA